MLYGTLPKSFSPSPPLPSTTQQPRWRVLTCFYTVIIFIIFGIVLIGVVSLITLSGVAIYRFLWDDEHFAAAIEQPSIEFILTIAPFMLQTDNHPAVTVYAYSGSVPGPVFMVDPGDTFSILVVNELTSQWHVSDVDRGLAVFNQYRDLNITNIHTHGLDVSPLEDDVFTKIVFPQSDLKYTYHLRPDQAAGTFWVHPHYHGSLAIQTAHTMASALIVRDSQSWWRRLPEQIFMIQRMGRGTGHIADDSELAFAVASHVNHLNPSATTFGQVIGGNKKAQCGPRFRRWRVINAAVDGFLNLWVSGKGCRIFLVARDGVYLAQGVPRFIRANIDAVLVAPGGRADFIVQVAKDTDSCRLKSSNEIMSKAQHVQLGAKSLVLETEIVQCEWIMTRHESIEVVPVQLPSLPNAMQQDVLWKTAGMQIAQKRVFRFTQEARNVYSVDGVQFSQSQPRFTIRLGRKQEWTIVNPYTESHPFHLHSSHFVVTSVVSSSGDGDFRNDEDDGTWWGLDDVMDTVATPSPGNVTIHFTPRFKGRTMFHCHTLTHETEGMAVAFDVI